MKRKLSIPTLLWYSLGVATLFAISATSQTQVDSSLAAHNSSLIPMDQLGAVAGKRYQGDGLSVTATPDGARLRCAFQRLEGEVTSDGLWLRSTAGDAQSERFRVVAVAAGRTVEVVPDEDFPIDLVAADVRRLELPEPKAQTPDSVRASSRRLLPTDWTLPRTGVVTVDGPTVRFNRPGLTEEYSVSVDGVRQDFIVEQRPEGDGELCVELDVTGAKVEPLVNGARLVLDGSGRKLAYNRLRVVDATGRELSARMEVASGILPDVEGGHPAARICPAMFPTHSFQEAGESAGLEATALRQAGTPAATMLAVLVDDAAAIYPVRIDPTFSDADWNSMVGSPGLNSFTKATVVDDSGNLYVGGHFTTAGGISANGVAKWDGTVWSAVGLGMNSNVNALAVSGTNLYAGGTFTTAGGTAANRIAKWNGEAWSALGSGMDNTVQALAASGTNLYAGGNFSTADGVPANRIAKWNGSAWSTLGSGLNSGGVVAALAVSGSNLYAGGLFGTAGGIAAKNIANWNGSAWSALGSGLSGGSVTTALAVSGTNLYVGGSFLLTSSPATFFIAKWNGIAWSALGSGVNNSVSTLAVSDTNLYAGGNFTSAGGSAASRIAKWDGNSWSALGSGMNSNVVVITVSGWNLYAGGDFTTAGNKTSTYIAAAYLGPALGRFSNLIYSPATGFSCTFSDGTVGRPYRIQTSPSLAVGPWTDLTNFIYASPVVITDTAAVLTTNTFYRAVTP